jgi:hypothetical protein
LKTYPLQVQKNPLEELDLGSENRKDLK